PGDTVARKIGVRPCDVETGDVGALAREPQRDGATDAPAARGAGDQGDLSGDSLECHSCWALASPPRKAQIAPPRKTQTATNDGSRVNPTVCYRSKHGTCCFPGLGGAFDARGACDGAALVHGPGAGVRGTGGQESRDLRLRPSARQEGDGRRRGPH